MIDVFEELNGHRDDADADAKAAEDVFRGLDMVRISTSQGYRIFVLNTIIRYKQLLTISLIRNMGHLNLTRYIWIASKIYYKILEYLDLTTLGLVRNL